MANDLDHRQIGYVAAICREGSLGRAAAALGIAQPTLSKVIARLEDRLGLKLFDRNGRGMTPTIFAEHLTQRSDEIGAIFASLHSDLNAMALGESGRLRIGLGPGMSHLFRIAMAQALFAAFPRLHLAIASEPLDDLFDGLRAGRFEFILANPARILPDDDFHELRVLEDRIAFFGAAGHPLAALPKVPARQLLDYPCGFPYLPIELARLFPARLDERQRRNLNAFETPDLLLLREIVRCTDAISYTLGSLLSSDIEAGVMSEIRLQGRWPVVSSFIATRAAWHSPVVRRISTAIERACSDFLRGASPAPEGHPTP